MTQEQQFALLTGNKAKWAYCALLQVATFCAFLAISPSWMGVFDTHFIGAWGSVAIMQLIPFLVPMQIIQQYAQSLADSRAREVELIERIRNSEGVIRDLRKEKPDGSS